MKRSFKVITALLLVAVMTVTSLFVAVPQSNAAVSFGSSYMSGPYYTKYKNVALTGDNRTDIVNVAASQIGYQEGNSSSQRAGTVMGSGNYTEYGRWYGLDGAYWCAMFVSWCAAAANIPTTTVKYHSYTETQLSWFRNRGQAYSWSTIKNGGYNPQPGDIIFFVSASGKANGRTTNHIGIVKSYSRSAQKLVTIEGNTSSTSFSTNGGCVAQKTYYHSSTYPVYVCNPSYVSVPVGPTYSTGVHEITSATLNVRDAATTSGSNILGSFVKGERFNCLQVVNDTWAKIDYYGQTAYVSIKSDYVKYIGGSTAITNPTDLVFDESTMASWAARGKDAASVVAYHTTETGAATARFCATSSTNDPMVYLRFQDTASFTVDDYNYISIVAQTNINKSGALFLCAGSITDPTPECYVDWRWEGDGMWREYIIDVSHLSNFSGVLNQMRFDYFDQAVGAGEGVNIRSIRFLKNKPQPSISVSSPVVNVGDPIKLTYSGMDAYTGCADGMYPIVVILPAWTCPGAGNNNLMLWNYIASSGEINVDYKALQVDPGFKDAFENYYNWTLPAGEYKAYLTYNTAGNNNFLHGLDLAADTASVKFTIVEKKVELDVEVSNGAASGNLVGTFADGTTVADIVDAGATVKDADGNEITDDRLLGTGMTVTSDFVNADGTTYTQTYTVVVKGDANGDGVADIMDAQAVLDHVKKGGVLSVAEIDATAMVTGSANLDIMSVVAMLNYI